jgi:hypothetical protein
MKSLLEFLIKTCERIWNSFKKQNLLAIGFLTTSVIALIFPIITLNTMEGLKLGIELVTSITTFLTLIIAIKLFDRFGIRKRVVDYQTDSIIKLIEELRITRCSLKGEKVTYFVWFTREQNSIKKILRERNEEKKIVVFHHGQTIIIPKNIELIMNDLWLPETIRNKMSFLDFNYAQIILSDKIDKLKFIVAEFENENQDGFVIKEELTSIQFLECIESLILEIKNWLEIHASIKIDLNLVPRSK